MYRRTRAEAGRASVLLDGWMHPFCVVSVSIPNRTPSLCYASVNFASEAAQLEPKIRE